MNEHGPAHRRGRIDDADLVRYLDGQLTAIERARVDKALADDAGLAARLHALRRRSARLRTLLADDGDILAPPPIPRLRPAPTTPHRPLLRAAAIAFTILATGLLVPPVRAWIAARLAGSAEHAMETTPPPAASSGAAADDALRLAFDATAATFAIEVERPQEAGTLTVRRAHGDEAGAQDATNAVAIIHDDAADAELLVLPGTLRIRNRDGARSSYTVVLPDTVRAITLRIGTRTTSAPLSNTPATWPLRGR